MTDLIIQNHRAPGDVLALTRTVRSLHECHPGKYQTAIRSSEPELWRGNPFVTPESELKNPRIITAEWNCAASNSENRHFIWNVTGDLARQVGVPIHVRDCRGDLYLTEADTTPAGDLIGNSQPFFLISPGGKTDMPTKIWPRQHWQAVIDHFRGRIQFVQVGRTGAGHGGQYINPELDGAISLVGKTSIRELIRLVYHAQGVVCGVTFLAHLAAAVPLSKPGLRTGIIIAGGREDVGTIQYTGQSVIGMAGTMPCCIHGGCFRLGMCEHNDGTYANCMLKLKPSRVIDAIESYFDGGRLEYLK